MSFLRPFIALALLATAQGVSDTCTLFVESDTVSAKGLLSIDYIQELYQYWSEGCSALKPDCILFPKTTDELSLVIKQLSTTNETFAFKSGGHNPNQYFSSSDGVLVALSKLNQVTYDPQTQLATIGSGNRWDNVVETLQQYDRTVVGGRVPNVGVGGYLVGGGLSYMSSQHGWAANNVVNYEVVLSNGTIVNANKDSHIDLFQVLKGGGSGFGIVSTYTLQTYPQTEKVWGGQITFLSKHKDALLSALRNFTANYPDDKAAIILTAERSLVLDFWLLFVYYDGPTPPAGVFDEFNAIPSLTNITKSWSYYDLLKLNDIFVLHGFRYNAGTETLPLPDATYSPTFLQNVYTLWLNATESLLDVPFAIGSLAFQPMPPSIVNKALDKGGDMMSFDRDSAQLLLDINYSYSGSSFDVRMDGTLNSIISGIRDMVIRDQTAGRIPNTATPLFMNDAVKGQDFWGRSKHRDFAKNVKTRYDPIGLFTSPRTGGFFP